LDLFLGLNPTAGTVPSAADKSRDQHPMEALLSRLVMAARHRREAHHIHFHRLCRRIHLEKASLFRRPEEKFKLTRSFTAR
jgi:hypothetical protein